MKRFLSPIIKYISILGALLFTFLACDRDYTTIESDIEGITNFNTDSIKLPAIAYNRMLGPVQTNTLSSSLFGIYTDPVYGKTTANVVTQLIPTVFNFDYPDNAEIDSVMLNIPYYSRVTGSDSNGNIYELDSVFGNENIELNIYQNNYFIRDLDPDSNLSEPQNYYSNSNQTINFDNFRGQLLYKKELYFPDSDGVDITENETIFPSLRVPLDSIPGSRDFWHDLFFALPEGAPELSNQNNFKDYFRGLYFKCVDLSNNGHMTMMNFSQGSVIIYYKWIEIVTDENGDDTEVENTGSIVMNFMGNRLNTLENDPSNMVISNADMNANLSEGDQNLYIKGGEGSIATIELFKGNIEDPETGVEVPALEYFKSKKDNWLVNEANLTFYVDQSQLNGMEPDRLVLMDLDNETPVVDYFFDPSTNNSNPLRSKTSFANILERNSNDEGVKYRFRITQHLNNILLRDSTNVRLGLFVTTNINEVQKAVALNYDEIESNTGSVISPRGTVLYGTNQNVPDNKKVKFELFYTEPNK